MNLTTASANLQALKSGGLAGSARTQQYYQDYWEACARLFALVQWLPTSIWPTWRSRRADVSGSTEDAITRAELLRRREPKRVHPLVGDATARGIPGRPYPGAMFIPASELADRLARLTGDRDIVAYCRGALLHVTAPMPVRIARDAGREVCLDDGMLE